MRYRRKHDRHAPRGWFNLFVRLGGWASLAAGVVLVVLTGFSAGILAIADRLDREGAYANAVVSDKRIVESTDSDGDTTYSYRVSFTFKTAQGGQTVEKSTGRSFYSGVSVGDEHVVRYLEEDPRKLEFEIGSYRRTGTVVRWVGLGLGVAGLAALWLVGSQTNRAIKARRDGERRMATVTGVRDTSVRVNGRRQGRLEWREADGRTGRSLMRDAAELRRLYKAGDPVVVFRLGRHCVWEGDVGPPRREFDAERAAQRD